MRKYIILGVQGSGKGTQAKLLAETLDLEHIGVGDIFRWNVEHHTKLGAQVRRSVAAGRRRGRGLKVLLQGRDQQDPLFLQVKEATASVLWAEAIRSGQPVGP